MGLIPLPKKIDSKERLRVHLQRFFKDFKIEPEGYIQNFDHFFSGSESFKSKEEAEVDLNNKINTIVESLNEDSYIMMYPQFYLPISEDMPQIILSKSIDGHNGMYVPRGNWLNVSMYPVGGTFQWFGTVIHEYAHVGTSAIDELDKASNVLTAAFEEYVWNDWDKLVTIPEEQFVEAINNNKLSEDYMTDMNRMLMRQHFDIDSYTQKMAKIDELFVRLKTNIAVSNHYHNLNDVYDTHPFTDKMVYLLSQFCWPDTKPIVMETNK